VFAIAEFTAESRRDGNRAIVRFDGELDCSAERLARIEIEIALERGGTELVIDLRGLEFMDARGVHVLLDANSTCRALNRRMTLIPGPDNIQRVLALCGVDRSPELVA
jgi:anti-sigma B factor antagonist